jgi:hypothetical protein
MSCESCNTTVTGLAAVSSTPAERTNTFQFQYQYQQRSTRRHLSQARSSEQVIRKKRKTGVEPGLLGFLGFKVVSCFDEIPIHPSNAQCNFYISKTSEHQQRQQAGSSSRQPAATSTVSVKPPQHRPSALAPLALRQTCAQCAASK